MIQKTDKKKESFFYSKQEKAPACCSARIKRCKYCEVLEVLALEFEIKQMAWFGFLKYIIQKGLLTFLELDIV